MTTTIKKKPFTPAVKATIGTLAALIFAGSEFLARFGLAGSGPIILIFVVVFLGLLAAAFLRRKWVFIGAVISQLVVLGLFLPQILRGLTVPDEFVFYNIVLITVVSVVVGVIAGLRAFWDVKRAEVSPAAPSRWRIPGITLIVVLALGLTIGGVATAYSAALSPGRAVSFTSPPTETLVIAEKGILFDTKELKVKQGYTVAVMIVNLDNLDHTFTIDELGVNVHNGPSSISLAVFSVKNKGSLTFYCTLPGHKDLGMWGTISVT